MSDPPAIEVDGRSIELSSLDKPFFPADGITKGQVIDYYRRIGQYALPYARNRPLSMQRFPDGIDADGFFQKQAADYFPDWIKTVTLSKKDGQTIDHVVVNHTATLVYLANQGMITPHIALSQIDRIDRPDRIVFDLDPSDKDFGKVQFAARAVRELCRALDLQSFVMTSGSRGLHVYIPCRRDLSFDQARQTARAMAAELARRHPDRLTVEQRKNKRGQRVYLDIYRNAEGQTSVMPYALRARPGAPVAAPLDWSEALAADFTPQKYGLKNIFRRLGHKTDPWGALAKTRQSLKPVAKRLQRRREQ